MSGAVAFSKEWHQFHDENVVPSDRHWLREIEEQLTQYASIWNKFERTDFKSLERTNSERVADRLKVTVSYLDFIQRVVLCRSVHLIGGFIDVINREDFDNAPMLLRATLEQAALGFHASLRIRDGFHAYYRDKKPNGEQLLTEAEVSTFFGAKMNFGAFLAGINEGSGTEYQFDVGETDLVKKLLESGQFSDKTVPKEYRGFTIEMISKMIDAVDAEHLQEGAPPGAYRGVWEWLSQYCHPSIFSWSFNRLEVIQGGSYSSSQEDTVFLKRMALDRFIRPMWEWVITLPGHAITKLTALESEIEQEVEALEGKP